jgi:predicted porin
MKKQFALAALAAACAAPAFAQSSVTVYGRLNVTIESRKIAGSTDKGVFDNASRIGFKGTEDLGGGLKAGFVIESGFNPTTGAAAGTFWGRQSEVDLSGNFGMIRIGNFTSEAYFATADYVSMHNHDTGISEDKLYAYPVGNSKKVAYRTPTMGGLVAELAVREGSAAEGRGYDFAANYDMGALHLGAGYDKVDSSKQFAVRALYELGAFTVGGYVQRDTDATGPGSRTNFRLSGMYTMGATELHANYGHAGNVGGVANTGASQFTFGVNQNLSKRTKVYGFYTKVDNKSAAGYVSGVAGGDASSFALGVRHNF